MGLEDKKEAIVIMGTEETLDHMEDELLEMDELYGEDGEDEVNTFYSALSGHLASRFQEFKDARFNSGIETEIVNSQRAFNSQYNPRDLAKIKAGGGSEIFMAVTNTKCRAIASWIKDILMNPNVDSFMIEPTPLQDLPGDLKQKIEEEINAEMEERKRVADEAAQAPPPEEGQPQPPQPVSKVQEAEKTLREVNQLRRDISDAVYEEIKKEGLFQIKQIERLIKDQLIEGKWVEALSDFIDDFVVSPTAIMKGPVIVKNKKLTWVNGEPVVSEDYVFENKRVSALDFYPSPSSTTIEDGDCLEHVRYSKSDIRAMKGMPFYKNDMIDKVLEDPISNWFNISSIEDDKAEIEKRGTEHEMNKDVIHGIHYFGKVTGELLLEWGGEESEFDISDPTEEYEVEVLMVGPEVIKCQINDDPLSRRPYYKASFCNIPGSFWGRSLPSIIEDDQRMCNATARSLADNLGLSSGPQVELYIDRLADAGEITDIHPHKIWQLTSDKTGGGGRAINFFSVPSNAAELLNVYDSFEKKADDASGLPKYAHGGSQGQGAAATAHGLSMLLESASKSIKNAIRNIDYGLIVPRVQYQFYYNLLKNPDLNYTGDVVVNALGSSALTIKGSQQLRRNEFLTATANPTDMAVLGVEGRAEILRVMADDLGLGKNIVPDNLELKRKAEEQTKRAQEEAQAQGSEKEIGLKATQLQVEGQMAMHQETQAVKKMELDHKARMDDILSRIKILEIEQRGEESAASREHKSQDTRVKEANANARTKAGLEATGTV
jgi:hypothetical protein